MVLIGTICSDLLRVRIDDIQIRIRFPVSPLSPLPIGLNIWFPVGQSIKTNTGTSLGTRYVLRYVIPMWTPVLDEVRRNVILDR